MLAEAAVAVELEVGFLILLLLLVISFLSSPFSLLRGCEMREKLWSRKARKPRSADAGKRRKTAHAKKPTSHEAVKEAVKANTPRSQETVKGNKRQKANNVVINHKTVGLPHQPLKRILGMQVTLQHSGIMRRCLGSECKEPVENHPAGFAAVDL